MSMSLIERILLVRCIMLSNWDTGSIDFTITEIKLYIKPRTCSQVTLCKDMGKGFNIMFEKNSKQLSMSWKMLSLSLWVFQNSKRAFSSVVRIASGRFLTLNSASHRF
eukprot:XP_001703959.1 Hypothetical protein GL50803_36883 [Giardia lamblia ATCC 50803]